MSVRLRRPRVGVPASAGARLRQAGRGVGYVVSGFVSGLSALAVLGILAAPLFAAVRTVGDAASWTNTTHAAALFLLGVLLTVGIAPLAAAPLAACERRRLRLLDPAAARTAADEPGPGAARFRARYTTARAWREVAAGYVAAVAGTGLALLAAVWMVLCLVWVTAPLIVAASDGPVALAVGRASDVSEALPYTAAGIVLFAIGGVALAVLVHAQARLTRALVEPRPEPLAARLVDVTRSRSRLADAFAAERRRIERDLHDGAQQRLVSLGILLRACNGAGTRTEVPPPCGS